MNIKEYIASGIVESYVLGLASDEERKEFEQLCAKYPELVEARTHFELLLEKQAMNNAEAPPVNSKTNIWTAIQNAQAAGTSKVIPMETVAPRRSTGMAWLAAASIILMLVTSYFAYNYRSKNKTMQIANDEMHAKMNSMDSVINQMQEEMAIMKNPGTTVINMAALKKENPNPPSASVVWDSTSSRVYLLVKNMPQLATDKQYQLWALLDGKPASLGLFDGGETKLMLRMENAQKADAFAITIEPRGNTGPPHYDDLQIMGKTK